MATATLTSSTTDDTAVATTLSTAEQAVIDAASHPTAADDDRPTVDWPEGLAEGRGFDGRGLGPHRLVRTPPSPRWYRRRLLLGGLLALVATLVVAGVAVASSDEPDPSAPAVAAIEQPGLGDVVSTDAFDFVVDDVDCGVTSIPTTDGTLRPRDQYCLLDLRATNTSGVEQPLYASTQYLRTSGGLEIAPDVVASLSASLGPSGSAGIDVAPDETVARTLVFDVPGEADLTQLRLQGTTLSGATVSLTS